MAEAAAGALDKAIALPASLPPSLPPSLPACGAPSVRPSERVSGAAVCVFPFETSELERARSANRKPASKMAGKRAHTPPPPAPAPYYIPLLLSFRPSLCESSWIMDAATVRIVWKRECDFVESGKHVCRPSASSLHLFTPILSGPKFELRDTRVIPQNECK